jgi:hypothetical protein
MEEVWSSMKTAINRRSFVKSGLTAAGVATAGAGLLGSRSLVLAQQESEEHSRRLTRGDAAELVSALNGGQLASSTKAYQPIR